MKPLIVIYVVLVIAGVGVGAWYTWPQLSVFLAKPPPHRPEVIPVAPKPPAPKPTIVNRPPVVQPEVKPMPRSVPVPETMPEPEPESDIDEEKLRKDIAALHPLPKITPLEIIVEQWNRVPQRAFPKVVTGTKAVEFKLYHEGKIIGARSVSEGTQIVPLSLSEGILTVAPDTTASMRGTIPVDDTDFKQLIEKRYSAFVEKQTAKVHARREAELVRVLGAQAKEVALSGFNDGSDPRFDVMKESLRKGAASGFELDNASEWRWLGEEKIEGINYETGIAAFEVESAFGVARTEIKALIKDGSVEKWIEPETGREI